MTMTEQDELEHLRAQLAAMERDLGDCGTERAGWAFRAGKAEGANLALREALEFIARADRIDEAIYKARVTLGKDKPWEKG